MNSSSTENNQPTLQQHNVGGSTVFNEDCLTGMKRYPDNYFDLAVVDPPYGINATNMQMGSAPNRSRTDGYNSGPSISTAIKTKGRLNAGSGKLKNRLLNTSLIDWDNEKPSQEYFDELFRVSKNQIIWGGNYFDLKTTRCVLCWDKCQPWENFSNGKWRGLLLINLPHCFATQIQVEQTQKRRYTRHKSRLLYTIGFSAAFLKKA